MCRFLIDSRKPLKNQRFFAFFEAVKRPYKKTRKIIGFFENRTHRKRGDFYD